MKAIISSFVMLIAPFIAMAQQPAQDSQDQQKVVMYDPDRSLTFINRAPNNKGFLYSIKNDPNYTIPNSVGLDEYNIICGKNGRLADIYLPTKLLRQVFTLDELTMLQNKHSKKDGSMDIRLSLNSNGRIIDMSLIIMHFGDTDIIEILTQERVKQLYIKLRDNLTYQMPNLDNRITQYGLHFVVYFKDVLMNKPMLCTNAPRQTK